MSKPIKLTEIEESCYRALKPSNEKFDFTGDDGKRVVFVKYTSDVIYNNKVNGNDNWGQLYYEPSCVVNSGMRGLQREPQKNKKGETWYKLKLGGYFDISKPDHAANAEALQRLEKMDAKGIAPYSGEMGMEDFNPENYKGKEFKPLLYFRKDPATNKPIAGTSPARYWPVSPYIDFKILVPKLDEHGQQIMTLVPKRDNNGQPIIDAEGKPVMESKAAVEAKPLSDYVPKKDPDTGNVRSEREIREIVFSMLEGVQFDYVPAIHHAAVTSKDGTARSDTSEVMVSAYLTAPPKKGEAVNQSQSVEHYAQQHNAEILAVQAEIEQLKIRIAEQQAMLAQKPPNTNQIMNNSNNANAIVDHGPGTNQPATDHKSDESFITQADSLPFYTWRKSF